MPGLRRAAGLPALVAAGVLAACGTDAGERAEADTDGPAGPVGDVRELAVPAGPGSGQPRFSSGPHGTPVLSWLQPSGDGHELLFAELGPEGWTEPRRVARGGDFFVNWADFPSVVPLGGGRLAAHWLERTGGSPYAYGVRVALSRDGGRSWRKAVIPHEDRSPTEHGFVTLLPAGGGGVRAVWLDGREFPVPPGDGGAGGSRREAAGGEGDAPASGGAGGAVDEVRAAPGGDGDSGGGAGGGAPQRGAAPEMTLRSAVIGPDGGVRQRALLDGRTCDCCQTSAAATSRGALVVYRDRSGEEVRDISAVRLEGGGWTEPRTVHTDGWRIEACPVNGPAVDARGDTAVVAWFTGAGRRPRVRAAYTTDGGETFGAPIVVDGGDPVGRVDVALLPGGDALVSWIGRAPGGEGARVLLRRVGIGGGRSGVTRLAATSAARASGFPRMIARGNRVLLAWTDPDGEDRVRVVEGRLRGR